MIIVMNQVSGWGRGKEERRGRIAGEVTLNLLAIHRFLEVNWKDRQ